jgi:hypothetical protein
MFPKVCKTIQSAFWASVDEPVYRSVFSLTFNAILVPAIQTVKVPIVDDNGILKAVRALIEITSTRAERVSQKFRNVR